MGMRTKRALCAYLESREMYSERNDLSRNENPTPLQVLVRRINCAGSVSFTIAPRNAAFRLRTRVPDLPAHTVYYTYIFIISLRRHTGSFFDPDVISLSNFYEVSIFE